MQKVYKYIILFPFLLPSLCSAQQAGTMELATRFVLSESIGWQVGYQGFPLKNISIEGSVSRLVGTISHQKYSTDMANLMAWYSPIRVNMASLRLGAGLIGSLEKLGIKNALSISSWTYGPVASIRLLINLSNHFALTTDFSQSWRPKAVFGNWKWWGTIGFCINWNN